MYHTFVYYVYSCGCAFTLEHENLLGKNLNTSSKFKFYSHKVYKTILQKTSIYHVVEISELYKKKFTV